MKIVKLLFIAVVIPLVFTACPERERTVRVVYVPSPPQATGVEAPEQAGGKIVIQEPLPPQHSRSAPRHAETQTAVAAARPEERPPRQEHAAAAAPVSTTVPATVTAPSADAPPLEPRISVQEQAALGSQVRTLKKDLGRRIQRLSRMRLSRDDVKTLHDARLYLAQADQAIGQGDLQQSLNLAQKAELLVQAVEKRH